MHARKLVVLVVFIINMCYEAECGSLNYTLYSDKFNTYIAVFRDSIFVQKFENEEIKLVYENGANYTIKFITERNQPIFKEQQSSSISFEFTFLNESSQQTVLIYNNISVEYNVTLNETHDGSTLNCLVNCKYPIYYKPLVITFIMEKPQTLDKRNNETGSSNLLVIFCLVTAIVIVCIIVIVYLIAKCKLKKQSSETKVQYAEIILDEMNSQRPLHRQEQCYAKIIGVLAPK